MERYADGDAGAFDALYLHLRPILLATLRRWLGLRREGERRLSSHLAEGPCLSGPLSKRRRRASLGAHDRAQRRPRSSALESLEGAPLEHEVSDQIEDPQLKEPWSAEDEAEVADAVRNAVDELPESSREVIRLHKLEGRSMAEVAEILGIREGAARVRAHRGYKALARALLRFRSRRS